MESEAGLFDFELKRFLTRTVIHPSRVKPEDILRSKTL
jgi:hypothetical protein